jgi:hypothetical protein
MLHLFPFDPIATAPANAAKRAAPGSHGILPIATKTTTPLPMTSDLITLGQLLFPDTGNNRNHNHDCLNCPFCYFVDHSTFELAQGPWLE